MIGSSSRGGKTVRLLAVHTTEGIRKCPDLLAYFEREYKANPNTAGSSHAAACDTCQSEFLDYSLAAWTIRSGNPISDNIELCGFASWTRAEWLTHMTMLDLTAQWLAKRAKARNIPLVKLTPAEVKAGKSGVIGHVDWTTGMSDGTHWDPGPSFPWDLVLTLANRYASKGVDVPLTQSEINSVSDAVANRTLGSFGAAWQTWNAAAANADAANKAVAALTLKVDKIATGNVDYDLLATKVADKLAARLSG